MGIFVRNFREFPKWLQVLVVIAGPFIGALVLLVGLAFLAIGPEELHVTIDNQSNSRLVDGQLLRATESGGPLKPYHRLPDLEPHTSRTIKIGPSFACEEAQVVYNRQGGSPAKSEFIGYLNDARYQFSLTVTDSSTVSVGPTEVQ